MLKLRVKMTAILLAAFVFAFLHTAIHTENDHAHDESCVVYVLEQFFFGVDSVVSLLASIVFLRFIFVAMPQIKHSSEAYANFCIRAPPFYTPFYKQNQI